MARDEADISRNNRGKSPSHRGRDRVIAELAAKQHGIVSTWQLVDLGFGQDAIDYRAKAGRLHRIHPGVYAVGHKTLTSHGNWIAAVLAYGPHAVLSHCTAAALWGIGKRRWKIDVTTPQHRHSRGGVRTHTALLQPEDVRRRDGIPVTSVARTILDLAAIQDEDRLTRTIEDSDRAGLLDLSALDRAIARRPRARGTKRLRAVLADYRGPADMRSNNERRFRALIKRASLPEPQFNVLVAGVLVDAHWPHWNLVVEIDSRAFHLTPSAFERDRIRDAQLQMAGYRVLRITEKRLNADPRSVLKAIRGLRANAG
jgi:very-short-patch-repair endonuclease